MLPEVGRQQGEQGDREQDADERKRPGQPEGRPVEGLGRNRGGRAR